MDKIPFHTHNDTDSPRLNTEHFFFPIQSSTPTDSAPNGTIRIHWDGSSTYRLYIRVNNTWKYTNLS